MGPLPTLEATSALRGAALEAALDRAVRAVGGLVLGVQPYAGDLLVAEVELDRPDLARLPAALAEAGVALDPGALDRAAAGDPRDEVVLRLAVRAEP